MSEKSEKTSFMQRNNIIRAAVMGANDGILSVSGIVLGVAGATSHTDTILLAGVCWYVSWNCVDGNGGICFGQFST